MRSFSLKLAILLLLSSWVASEPPKMLQIAPFSAIIEGDFVGKASIEDLSREYTFGLGVFEGLNGEMVAYQGKFYQINAKGQVFKAKKRKKLAFAQVVRFKDESFFELENLRNYKLVSKSILKQMDYPNLPYAVLIKGKFAYLKLRSFKEAKKPYKRLSEAIEEQATYHYEEIEGTAIGFWSPDYWGNLTVDGFHFHFLSDSYHRGGHIKDMHLLSGEVYLMPIQNLEIFLPKTRSFNQLDLEEADKEGGKLEGFSG